MRDSRFVLAVLAAVFITAIAPATSSAQEPIDPAVRDEARRILADAEAHVAAERWAMAAQAYQRLYEFMSGHGLARACIAQWNRGLALMRIPGHERDARDAFQLFLRESTPLTDDAQVRDWRSTALEHVFELEARIGSGSDAPVDVGGATPAEPVVQPTNSSGSVSPVGPIVLGFGGAALAVGAIFGGVVLAQDDELIMMCPDGRCPSAARASAEEIERLAIASDVLLIGGAAVAAAGLVLTLALREDAPSVAAACGPNGCRVQLEGRF